MSINDRLYAVAKERVRKIETFCAAKRARRDALENLFFKLLKSEYSNIPDQYKEEWLHEQETKKAI